MGGAGRFLDAGSDRRWRRLLLALLLLGLLAGLLLLLLAGLGLGPLILLVLVTWLLRLRHCVVLLLGYNNPSAFSTKKTRKGPAC